MSTAEQGDGRYVIESKLGEGGAGVVYLARDRETGERLALKKLLRVDGKSILRLKREFRSMQAINHPHIIKLYDMGQAADSWYLAMEYLAGPDLRGYLSGDQPEFGQPPTDLASPAGLRILSAFHQLARGVHALHDAGMLHRDLKPSNVMVVDGRVVVLDFGLVREIDSSAPRVTEEGGCAGTPTYMAPEQIGAKELTAAADWYAYGVMLYEAVSGLLPFDGPLPELLRGKLQHEPPPLQQWVPEAPAWLNDLCASLLQRDPKDRPSGTDVLARFESALRTAEQPRTGTENILYPEADTGSGLGELFGRGGELKQLWRALSQAEDGCSVVMHVRGDSGSGKSALVERFLHELESGGSGVRSGDALVLRSRCYELEAMPFKALDGVIDALTSHLSGVGDLDVAHVLPTDISELAQLFPVLGRLNAVTRLGPTRRTTKDPLLQRKRAEAALRVLLEKLAARTPLVLWIDDLQWGDLDSARILKSWLSQSSSAPILFVFSYRSDEVATSSCLRALLHDDSKSTPDGRVPEDVIELAPLAGADIQALCDERLPRDAENRAALIARIEREAQGSPFLATQLLALADAKSCRGDSDLQSLSIDHMVTQTSNLLSPEALHMLNVLAAGGRPMLPKLALEAAGIERGGRALVHTLRGLNLVRTRDIGGARMLEVYHDRIRERISAALSTEAKRLIYQRLFDTLEFSAQADPDWLHSLARGAGRRSQALHYGNAAAERANQSLAFERAAGLHRACIELVPAEEAGELWTKLSLALARCGRAVESAAAALEAAKHAPPDKKILWMRRAASHLLRSGHFAEGEALVREVLAAKGISVPTTDAGTRAAIAWERAWTKVLGTGDTLRPIEECSPDLLERFDILMSLYTDMHQFSTLRGALFQARALRCALEAGEPTRLFRALTSSAMSVAFSGSAHAGRESDALLERAARVNAKLRVPDLRTFAVIRATCAYALGRLQEVRAPLDEAIRLLRSDSQDDPIGNYQRRLGVGSIRIAVLQFFGEYAQCEADLRSLLEEAIGTDNRSAQIHLTRGQMVAEQIAGHAERAQPRLEAQRQELPASSFGVLHAIHLISVMSTACWTRDFAWAAEYLEDAWPRFLRSPMRKAAYLGLTAYAEHAHLLLNRCVLEDRPDDADRDARDDIRALEKLTLQWAPAFVDRFRARIAVLSGSSADATRSLRSAAACFQAVGVRHETARDEYALGMILRSEEGAALRSAAARRMSEMGVVDPEADVRVHYPELFEAR